MKGSFGSLVLFLLENFLWMHVSGIRSRWGAKGMGMKLGSRCCPLQDSSTHLGGPVLNYFFKLGGER